MNKDMKRLCLAANRVVRGSGPAEDCGPLPDGRVEAIVTAVLEELKAVMSEGKHKRDPIPLGLYTDIIVGRLIG